MIKKYLSIIIMVMLFTITHSQINENYSFFIRAVNLEIDPHFESDEKGYLQYVGNDNDLAEVFNKYKIFVFEKTFSTNVSESLSRVFTVKVNSEDLMPELLREFPFFFEFGEFFEDAVLEDYKEFGSRLYNISDNNFRLSKLANSFFPNDYFGGGSLNIDNHVYDYLGMPDAWNYTTGSPEIIIGISDGAVWDSDRDFADKTTFVLANHSAHQPVHGNGVAGIAAARGNNNYGMAGVCYDCDIINTKYGFDNLNSLVETANAGASVINCSWGTGYSYIAEETIEYIYYKYGTIVVAAAGNNSWASTGGTLMRYPAAFDRTISVTGMAHRYESPMDNIWISNGNYIASNVKNHIGYHGGFVNNDITQPYYTFPAATMNLNTAVDIASVSMESFHYGKWVVNGVFWYRDIPATSSATPHVSGTVALMLDLNPCLTFEEVQSVLKLTSTNIDYIPNNTPYLGHYGSGALNSHKAVEMVFDMITTGRVVKVANQNFSRWDFILESAPERIEIKNQVFRGSATADFKATQSIELLEDVDLKPGEGLPGGNSTAFIELSIDPTLLPCSIGVLNRKDIKKKNTLKAMSVTEQNYATLYPNPNNGNFTILLNEELGIKTINITIYDLLGRVVYDGLMVERSKTFELQNISSGIYMVRLSTNDFQQNLKFIKR